MTPPSSSEPPPPSWRGFRWPAEWEPHRATWLTWPRRESDSFPGARYDAAAPVIARLIREIAAGEEVQLNVWDATAGEEARAHLARAGVPLARVTLHEFPAYEPWCRDHGPLFLVRDGPPRERALLNWGYNAWGGKYPPWDLDDQIPLRIAAFRGLPVRTPGWILEGGSLESNGAGTLLTTESCLLNPNRNPDLTRADWDRLLRDWLGARQVIWLGAGIVGDDTDGHVDDLTRFVDARTLVTAVEPDPADPNHAPLAENLARLRAARDPDGRPFRVVTLPLPGPVIQAGRRLPATYLNFYVANAAVIVPTYRDPRDREALATLRRLFPDRPVVGLDATDLIWGLGAFHCLTQPEFA
jgi:agmatine deiminase